MKVSYSEGVAIHAGPESCGFGVSDENNPPTLRRVAAEDLTEPIRL